MSDYIVIHGIRIAKDFVPETFGRLTTVGPRFMLPHGKQGKSASRQVCKCTCGALLVVARSSLVTGNSISCGCFHREISSIIGKNRAKHGMRKTPEYGVWSDMKKRCNNPNSFAYPDYGKRGISVCPEWDNANDGFQNFIAFMGPRPSTKHEIERKDNDGNYCPENCKWATRTEQTRNQRSNVNVTHNGKTQCLTAWAEELGMPYKTLWYRLTSGWTVDEAFSRPLKKTKADK